MPTFDLVEALLRLSPKSIMFQFTMADIRIPFSQNARRVVGEWFVAHPQKPLNLKFGQRYVTVLPPSMADEIRDEKRLSFRKALQTLFSTNLPGFDVFNLNLKSRVVHSIALKYITKQLNQIAEPLADEAAHVISELFSDNKEWHTINLRSAIRNTTACTSSFTFLSDQLCRNQNWLKVTGEYSDSVFKAADRLSQYPAYFRRLANCFIPECKANRALLKEAHDIMRPLLQRRAELQERAVRDGKPTPEFDDAIAWVEFEARGENYNPVLMQMLLAAVAIQTTTDLMCQTLIQIAKHPEIIPQLRSEIVSALKEKGWEKTSLHKMTLLDSVIKESQRLKPFTSASMNRVATESLTLSNGTYIPQGHHICVSSHRMWSAEVYQNPDTWDPYRFVRMRENDSDKQHKAHLVTSTPEHLGFGYGRHTCPGRFFAASEVKILLAVIFLSYNIRLSQDPLPKEKEDGFSLTIDPETCLQVQRRDADPNSESHIV